MKKRIYWLGRRYSSELATICLILALPSCTGGLLGENNADSRENERNGAVEANDPTNQPGESGATKNSKEPRGPGGVACDSTEGIESMRTGQTPMRRLTRTEYNNSVRFLLNDTTNPALKFPVDDSGPILLSNVASSVDGLFAEKYRRAAENLAAEAVKDLSQLLPCNFQSDYEKDACSVEFIGSFGRKAFRRPLSVDETAALKGLYDTVYADISESPSFKTRIQVIVSTMLQAPSFLYRTDAGNPNAGGEMYQLDAFEIATRLSFLLWASTPDDTLLDAADTGELSSENGIQAQIARMVKDPKFSDGLESFHMQWLGIYGLTTLEKDQSIFKDFSSTLREDMLTDLRSFLEDVIVKGDAKLNTLLTKPMAFVTPELALLYGVNYPGSSREPIKVNLPAAERAGLLTSAAFLATHATPTSGSPTQRGVAIRDRLLCGELPEPPADVPELPEFKEGQSTRERFAAHTVDPSCAGCHLLIDPIGFGLENFDGIGKYREEEAGLPIDSTGELFATDVDGKFTGGVELAKRLSNSDDVRECVTDIWLQFALGREVDDCTVSNVKNEFAAADYSVRDLLVAVASSDAFRFGKKSK